MKHTEDAGEGEEVQLFIALLSNVCLLWGLLGEMPSAMLAQENVYLQHQNNKHFSLSFRK